MIQSVSNVRFTSAIGAMDKISQEQLYSPGAYAVQEILYPDRPIQNDRGGFLGFLGRLVLTAAVVGGTALAARRFVPALSKDSIDVTQKLAEGAKPMQKVKYYVAKFGEWVDKNTLQRFSKAKDSAKDAVDDVKKEPPNAGEPQAQ